MKIISVSRRTDIPAFYAEWFMNRVRAGYCTVPNPYNSKQVSRVSLKPADVSAFVFWTRDPKPLMKHLPELDRMGFHYYFQYTVIGYPRAIDPHCPSVEESIKTLCQLSQSIGKERVIWRYDPILFSDLTGPGWHQENISFLIDHFAGHVKRLVISFVDPYRKTRIRLNEINSPDVGLAQDAFEPETYREIAEFIGKQASKAGIEVQTCAETGDLSEYGIQHGQCIDGEIIRGITGQSPPMKKDPSQREQCGCIVSKDIGMNNTCLFGCKYCYATSSMETAGANHKKHDPASPSLVGWVDDPGAEKRVVGMKKTAVRIK